MSKSHPRDLLPVAKFSDLEAKGILVVTGADRPVAVILHEGQVFAVDNRCPHLGFPLHKGSVRDGLLTCHWHEARFDLCSGCTFDLWADDVPAFDVEVREGTVYLASHPRQPADRAYHTRRLIRGLETDVSLVQAKSMLGLRKLGTEWIEVLRDIALFGGRHHDFWAEGMTLLALAGNLLPYLSRETAYHVVFRACRQVGSDCSGAPARRERQPLTGGRHAADQLQRWIRGWVQARHRDGAERVLLTALEQSGASAEFADLVFTAASDRVYAQIGHVFDGWNKAFELLDGIGWEHAAAILPLVVEGTVSSRGAEEDAHWHHPVELIAPLREAERELPQILEAARGRSVDSAGDLLPTLLGEDPLAIVSRLQDLLRSGMSPVKLAQWIAYAAALRLARFSSNNEVSDWFNPRHTFIFANAVYQAVQRAPTPGVVRGLFHAALSVYMDRFLNVPPARLRDVPSVMDQLPTDSAQLRERLLAAFDRQSNLEEAALLTLRCLRLAHPLNELIDILALATAREDFDFHALQVLEAGARQCTAWGPGPEAEQILVGVVRQLAAICPTPRAAYQIAGTAIRLERGDRMYEESDGNS